MPLIIPSVLWPLVGIATFIALSLCSVFIYYCVDSYSTRRNRAEERSDAERTQTPTVEEIQMTNFSSQSFIHPVMGTFQDGGYGRLPRPHRGGRERVVDLRRIVLSSRARHLPGYTNFVDLTWKSESDQSMESSLARNVNISDDVGSSAWTKFAEKDEDPPLYASLTGDLGLSLPRTSTMVKEEPYSEEHLKSSDEGNDGRRELGRSALEGRDPPLYVLPRDVKLDGRNPNEDIIDGSESVGNTILGDDARQRDLPSERKECRTESSIASRYRGIWVRGDSPNFGVSRAWAAARGVIS